MRTYELRTWVRMLEIIVDEDLLRLASLVGLACREDRELTQSELQLAAERVRLLRSRADAMLGELQGRLRRD